MIAIGANKLFASASATEPVLPPEQRKAEGLEAARDYPLAVRLFLLHMPKGAELDYSLLGSTYAESYIRMAAEDGMCVDSTSYVLSPKSECSTGQVPVRSAFTDQALYDGMVRALSMQDFPSPGTSLARAHFAAALKQMSTFEANHLGEMLNEVTARAAAQNVQYMEIVTPLPWKRIQASAARLTWRDDPAEMRRELLRGGMAADVAEAKATLDRMEAIRRERQHCGQPGEAKPSNDYWLTPPCSVQVRYLYQVEREAPLKLFFAQALAGHELMSADKRIAGISISGREDSFEARNLYRSEMQILCFLRGAYPDARTSIQAGEVAPNSIPPEERCCQVRMALEQGETDRI